ncbi:MAG: lysylphosphatidylglycerol synthase transmembrane domain-containing protein [Nitriliruptoraceae bacterium]
MVPRGLLDPTMLAFVVAPVGLIVTIGWGRAWRQRAVELSDVGPAARPRRWASIGLLVGLIAVGFLVWRVGPDALVGVLGRYRLPLLALAVALQAAALIGYSRVYRAVFALTGGHLGRREALQISLGAYACMQMLPAGGVVGGVFAARQLTRHGGDRIAAATTVVLFGLVSMGTLASMLSIATIISALITGSGGIYAVVSVVLATIFIGGILLVRTMLSRETWRRWLGAQVNRLRWKGRAPFAGVLEDLERHRNVLHRPRVMIDPVLWSVAAWTAGIAMFAVLVQAAGGASFTAILVSFAVAHLLNGVPFTPGGIGLVELGMAGTLIAFGTDPAVASVAVLSYRLVASWLPIAVALPVVGSRLRTVVSGPQSPREAAVEG